MTSKASSVMTELPQTLFDFLPSLFFNQVFLPCFQVRMDQYFERLQRLTESEQLPMRIKFLLQDIIDLRRNKWQFRRVGKGPEGPRTIQQVDIGLTFTESPLTRQGLYASETWLA